MWVLLFKILRAEIVERRAEIIAPRILRWLLLASIFLLPIFCTLEISHAASVDIVSKRGRGEITLSGEIVPRDALKLWQALITANRRGLKVLSIRLNSGGGNVRESVTILRIVKFARLVTVVSQSDTCSSSCFLIFAAGKSRIVYPKARIGVHAASDDLDWKTDRSLRGTLAAARIAQRLRVPREIRFKMIRTPPTEMAWLRRSELLKMKTVFR